MNKLTRDKRIQVLSALVEGNSIRATVRMTGVAKNTVVKLLVDAGRACAAYQDRTLCNLTCKRIQADEVWSVVYAKQRNLPDQYRGKFGFGDLWTWVAMDSETKLVVSYMLGSRDAGMATEFMNDVASRLSHRVQLTTDGNTAYLDAVEDAFGSEVDYGMLVKLYGQEPSGEKRYSPAKCLGARKSVVSGNPDRQHISTSHIERQNLTMRMSMRRFTRLTNAFSKKVENLGHALALHFLYYNFCRIHQTLRVTPAMQAGVTNHLWEIEDIVRLIDSK